MDGRSLARELVRARIYELMDMKNTLEKIGASLEKILIAQMELLSRIEVSEESIYVLASEIANSGASQDGHLSFGALLEMAVNRLNG